MNTPSLILDRDGIINCERGTYTWLPNHWLFCPGIFEVIRFAISNKFKVFIITNQGGIDKTLYSAKQYTKLTNWYYKYLLLYQCFIIHTSHCPHHSDNTKCLCRKPKSLLYEEIINRYNLEVNSCIFIGDNIRDVIPAHNLEIETILINAKSFAEYKGIQFNDIINNINKINKIIISKALTIN